MLDKIDSGKLIIELTRQMQGVDRRWTAQRVRLRRTLHTFDAP